MDKKRIAKKLLAIARNLVSEATDKQVEFAQDLIEQLGEKGAPGKSALKAMSPDEISNLIDTMKKRRDEGEGLATDKQVGFAQDLIEQTGGNGPNKDSLKKMDNKEISQLIDSLKSKEASYQVFISSRDYVSQVSDEIVSIIEDGRKLPEIKVEYNIESGQVGSRDSMGVPEEPSWDAGLDELYVVNDSVVVEVPISDIFKELKLRDYRSEIQRLALSLPDIFKRLKSYGGLDFTANVEFEGNGSDYEDKLTLEGKPKGLKIKGKNLNIYLTDIDIKKSDNDEIENNVMEINY